MMAQEIRMRITYTKSELLREYTPPPASTVGMVTAIAQRYRAGDANLPPGQLQFARERTATLREGVATARAQAQATLLHLAAQERHLLAVQAALQDK